MSQAFTSRGSGEVTVDSTLSDSEPIAIGAYRRIHLFFAATFSANAISVYALQPKYQSNPGHASAFVDTGVDITPAAGKSVVLDSDLIGHEQIKLLVHADDDGEVVGWRGV